MHGPDEPLTPVEERVRNVVRSLPHAEANPAFRNRLRREFSTGRFERRRARAPEPTLTRWFAWRWATAATAILLAIGFAFLNRGPDWRIVGGPVSGSVIVNGKVVPASDRAALAKALRRGGRIGVPVDGELTLLTPGTLLVQVTPGSDVEIPVPRGRWLGKKMHGVVNNGEARLLTGPDFAGTTMDIWTEAGNTVVTGTLVSVVTNGELTCVCVAEGTARAGNKAMDPIPAGMRKVMFTDNRPDEMLPIEAEHAAGLAALLREHGKDVGK